MRHYRFTLWTDDRGNVIQVSCCAMLDWEPRSEATHHVGPFDTVEEVCRWAQADADNLYDNQIAGQLRLL